MIADLRRTSDLLETFIADRERLSPREAEERLLPILKDLLNLQGYVLADEARPESPTPDFVADPAPESTNVGRLGIEYKHHRRRADLAVIDQVVGLAHRRSLQKFMIVSAAGFTKMAREAAQRDYPVDIELYDFDDMRAMVSGIAEREGLFQSRIVLLIRALSEQAARIVSANPRELDSLEWRDLERMVAMVLEKIGFDAHLTPASKDGGKDVLLTFLDLDGTSRTFVVELKHWRSGQHVGAKSVKDFVEVVAKEGHERGLFLSTYGYTQGAFSSLTEVERTKVRFGDKNKIVNLCRTYVRAERGLWSPTVDHDLPNVLFEDTL